MRPSRCTFRGGFLACSEGVSVAINRSLVLKVIVKSVLLCFWIEMGEMKTSVTERAKAQKL